MQERLRVGWEDAAPVRRHEVSLHSGFGKLPDSGDTTQDLTLTVPLNTRLEELTIWGDAGSAAAGTTGWQYTLHNADGTVIATIGGADTGGTQTAGFSVTKSLGHYRCSTTNKTQLTLTSNASTVSSGTNVFALIRFYT